MNTLSFLDSLLAQNLASVLARGQEQPLVSERVRRPARAIAAKPLTAIEIHLVDQARAGNTSPLIEYFYTRRLVRHAWRLKDRFELVEVDDLIQVGIEAVLRRMNKALLMDNPCAWLQRTAQLSMLSYCSENCSLIRVPRTSQQFGKKIPVVRSLDAILHDGTENLTLLDRIAGEAVQT